MDNLQLTLFLAIGSMLASMIGALSGMGGGVILVPLLVLGAGVEIHYAIGASLIAIIVTSLGASLSLVKEGLCHVKMAIFFSTATIIGAIFGAHIAIMFSASLLSLIFGAVLLGIAALAIVPASWLTTSDREQGRLARWLELNGKMPEHLGGKSFEVIHVPFGYVVMVFAGIFSGLLGIGSGSLQVPIMDRCMKVPFKVASATSNFVIGMTGVASAGIYLNRGYIDPSVTMPIVIGGVFGAIIGAHLLEYIRTVTLRRLFLALILFIALHMIYTGVMG